MREFSLFLRGSSCQALEKLIAALDDSDPTDATDGTAPSVSPRLWQKRQSDGWYSDKAKGIVVPHGRTFMVPQIIHPESVHSTAGVGYSHVAKVGNMLFVAGQIALDPDGNLVGENDIESQVRQVYTNLRSILTEFGGDLTSIVKKTTYLTDRSSLDAFRKVRNQFFSDPFPPNTLLFINGLARPEYLVEIEAIAMLDS